MATPTTLPASFVSGAVLTSSQMNNLRGAFRVLQVVSTTKTDTFTTTSTSFVDVTGLSATITPSSTSSKILVVANINGCFTTGSVAFFTQLVRGSTNICVGDAAGSRSPVTNQLSTNENGVMGNGPVMFLDSPNTTSATTYKLQIRGNNAITIAVNRSVTDTDNSAFARSTSTITVMEISA